MISNLAYIHPQARIGKNVTIGPFCSVDADVEIGDNTWIGSNVSIMDGARIGQECRIFPGAVISAIPQDLKFEGEMTYTVIGDRSTIRECATINRGTKASGKTVIGKEALLMAYVHVAHDCYIGNNCILVNAVQMAGHVVMEDFAIVGGTSAVHQFSRIGAHAMVSGGALIRKDVPPFVKAGREPLTFVGINSLGLRRRGFSNDKIIQIQDIYRILFQKGYNNTDALGIIEAELPDSQERRHIVDFVKASERGIIRGGGSLSKENSTGKFNDDF
mgnify:CR=1 FL=1